MEKKEAKEMEGELMPVAMLGITAADLVAQGASLTRLENATQMQVSVQRPRNEVAILKAALMELDIYPSLAEEALYSKPVGKDHKPTCNNKFNCSCPMKYATGLSIRTAESLANRWGNNAYGCEITADDEHSATLSAVYLDYETNTRTVLQKRVSKTYKSRSGGLVKYSPDRFDVALAANQSKILREAILRRLPAGLKKEYELKVKEVLKTKPIAERLSKVVERFAELGVKKEQIETLQGKTVLQFGDSDLTELLGVYNAIKDGEVTINELIEQKAPVHYDLPEKLQTELNDLFDILGMNEAERAMKLGACKGDAAAAEKLRLELTELVKTKGKEKDKEKEKTEPGGGPDAGELFNGKKAAKK